MVFQYFKQIHSSKIWHPRQMNLVIKAKTVFGEKKPEHFTDFDHCEECHEHDQMLIKHDVDSIGLVQLGNPGWDPLCFSSPVGIKYYLPALIRLSLETVHKEFYFGQFLFHLEGDGPKNKLWLSCSKEQRELVAEFLDYMLCNHVEEIESECCSAEMLKCMQIWSAS
jgi:hypothetical protein